MPANAILTHSNFEALKTQFETRVQKAGPDDCWPWLGPVEPAGYGLLTLGGNHDRVHRWAYVFHHRKPIGRYSPRRSLCICHECDNRSCCNPKHLFEGTDADNAADMAQKGRVQRGEAHYAAKLTAEQVLAIRLDPRPSRAVATEYGVRYSTVNHLRKDGSWPSLGPVVMATLQPAPRLNQARGERSAMAMLTEEQVYAIRADPRSGREIAADLGIGLQNVYQIKRRKTWAHLPPRPEDVKTGGKRGRPRNPDYVPPPPKKLAQLRRAAETIIASREEMDEGWFVPAAIMAELDKLLRPK